MPTRADVDGILKLIDASDCQELKLELRKAGSPRPAAPPAAPVAVPTGLAPVAATLVASGGGSEVSAPLLGAFYRAPRPGADPFVQVCDSVTADTVIGIIEVMKLMNSVPAGIAGTVTEIVVENGQLVEHGQTLLRSRPA